MNVRLVSLSWPQCTHWQCAESRLLMSHGARFGVIAIIKAESDSRIRRCWSLAWSGGQQWPIRGQCCEPTDQSEARCRVFSSPNKGSGDAIFIGPCLRFVFVTIRDKYLCETIQHSSSSTYRGTLGFGERGVCWLLRHMSALMCCCLTIVANIKRSDEVYTLYLQSHSFVDSQPLSMIEVRCLFQQKKKIFPSWLVRWRRPVVT